MKKFQTKNKISNLAKLMLCTVLISLTSCETTLKRGVADGTYNGSEISILEIDSCEYIYLNYDVKSLTHKGNCKFCTQRSAK